MAYKVYFARMGYTDNPQNYIVDINREIVEEVFQFTRNSDSDVQQFEHSVSIQFIEVSMMNLTSDSYTPAPVQKIPDDFWYPFYIRSTSVLLAASSAIAGLSVIFVMC